ncbi:transcriptional repressor LexA (plasmid) [Streptomyces sp. Qhu-G9]|uniref:transcriptional repressor LexA n=1 Tax=Streptomyces sp. Qhu-G9 TaxID=3452799 RepID=UPI0022ABCC8A|nr:transcriptional repressor LexA [Streptomyces aurantiacus]WAU78309.1 transcriptional repressor LexA [Streptomyces aurantiacus]
MEATAASRYLGRPPGIVTREDGLTDRQRRIVNAIRSSIRDRGYPPSMRELGQAAGLASTSSVAHQIGALVKKGVLRQDPKRPRAYVPTTTVGTEAALALAAGPDHLASDSSVVHTPLVGRIAAGAPITADQHVEDVLALPKQLVGSGELFALTVSGDSMIKAHVMDGDTVAVRAQPDAENGEIVAAMIDGEATVKRLKREGSTVWLMPENDAFQPICGNDATILGKVVAVMRSL